MKGIESKLNMESGRKQSSKSFEDLIVWQKAHKLVLNVYSSTRKYPKEEIYALTSQLRRSAISVAANIAEGFKKKSAADKVRVFNIAQGSLSETQYYLLPANDLEYDKTGELRGTAAEVSKLLESYMNAIKRNN